LPKVLKAKREPRAFETCPLMMRPSSPVALSASGEPMRGVPSRVAVAVTVFRPTAGPRVSVVRAVPCASVVAVAGVTLPPPAVTAKVTGTLAKG
jgi:hypothetical protein